MNRPSLERIEESVCGKRWALVTSGSTGGQITVAPAREVEAAFLESRLRGSLSELTQTQNRTEQKEKAALNVRARCRGTKRIHLAG